MLVSGFRECIPAWFPSVFSIMITKLARFGRILVLFFELLAPVQLQNHSILLPQNKHETQKWRFGRSVSFSKGVKISGS